MTMLSTQIDSDPFAKTTLDEALDVTLVKWIREGKKLEEIEMDGNDVIGGLRSFIEGRSIHNRLYTGYGVLALIIGASLCRQAAIIRVNGTDITLDNSLSSEMEILSLDVLVRRWLLANENECNPIQVHELVQEARTHINASLADMI